ncbi:MAG: DUF2914 domain-containing protein [Gammaproteobacteria bacterium]
MRRHRRRTRGIAYRLTRVTAVATLVLWGGLFLAAVLNYNEPADGEISPAATQAGAGTGLERTAEGSNRAAENTGAESAESNDPVAAADNRPTGDEAPDQSSLSAHEARDTDASADKAAPAVTPESVTDTEPVVRANAEPPAVEAQGAPARQTTAGGSHTPAESDPVESDMARLETAPEGSEPSSGVDHIARAQFTTRIEGREPVDRVEAVFSSNGQALRTLFYFTEITGLSGETVTHRWEHEGRVMAEVSFDIGSDRWRVYSSKDLTEAMTGEWRVVVTDSQGQVIKTDSFAYDES